MARKKANFEMLMKELEEYVKQLEEGSLSLDEAVKVFQKGLEVSKACSDQLEQAEKKIMILTEDLQEQPFTVEEQ